MSKIPAVCTLHPAAIMRSQELLPACINDLAKSLEAPPEYYNLFPSLDDVRNFQFKEFAFDIETNGFSREIVIVGLSPKPNFAIVVPFKGAYVQELQRIFNSAESVIGHNCIQFDLPILRESGVQQRSGCVVYDTMLMQHLVFPDLPHDLEFVGSQFSSKPAWKHDKDVFQRYCARDVDVTMQAFQQLRPMLEERKLMDLYLDVQVPLAKICHAMHEQGFTVDPGRISEVRTKLIEQSKQEELHLPAELRTYSKPCRVRRRAPAGYVSPKTKKPVKFILEDSTELVTPWRSPQMKQKFLYGKEEPWQLGMEVQYDVKSGNVTTGKIALDKLYRRAMKDNALLEKKAPRAIQALKNLNKWDELISTFASESMLKVGKQHPHFNVHGTNSGRLSSSDPNCQNIPESARVMYVASHPGWRILDVDYSGIENRLTAWFSGDKSRLDRFASIPGFSEHKWACEVFFGIPYAEVEKDNDKDAPYGKAKRIVHGTGYGLGAKKMSLMFDLDFKETKELIDKWKKALPELTSWQQSTWDKVQRDGYLRNPFGRMRSFYTSSAYTESLSFLPQSTAADVIFRAMIGLMWERIGLNEEAARKVCPLLGTLPSECNLLLSVHDSLIIEYDPLVEEELIQTVTAVMQQPWKELNGLALPIGVQTGPSWGEVKPYA